MVTRIKKRRKSYSKEFKVEAVKLVLEQGMTRVQVARDLGLDPYVVGRWVIQYQEDAKHSFPGKGRLRPEAQRVRELEEELNRTRMERDILKKAMAYFAKLPE
jgi:transposase